MKCKICGNESVFVFKATVLKKYEISYFSCPKCGFLQTEEPYWLNEAYKESINSEDTGYLNRNIYLSKKVTVLISTLFNNDGNYLDFAGGYGILVRLMRDIGFNFYWYDKYTENIFAKGFEFNDEKIDAITSFESFEHFENPVVEIEKMLKISKNIIFSTLSLPSPIPKPDDWWYFGLNHGQHISFYSEKTFQFLSDKYNLKYYDLGPIKLFTTKKIPFYSKYFLKLTKIGIHNVLIDKSKSKTREDYLKMSRK